MQPFFSYFGSKYRLASRYPLPRYPTIVEPFAGSAGYSLLYPSKDVILYDTCESIVELWNYLIEVSADEIRGLPLDYDGIEFSRDNPVTQCNIAPEAKILIGFWLTESQTYPSAYPLSKSRGGNWNQRKRNTIASQVGRIRHWKAIHGSYHEVDNLECVWFIDPPYFEAGKRYKHSDIDYRHLSQWSKDRRGQVIVCEQGGADWLPFHELKSQCNGSNNEYKELVWTNMTPHEIVKYWPQMFI